MGIPTTPPGTSSGSTLHSAPTALHATREEGTGEGARVVYHSTQIQIATRLKHNIELMLDNYYSRSLESFTNLKFHIYTARFNTLQEQTTRRLCDRKAGCFSPTVYKDADDKELLQLAGQHVDKYMYNDLVKNRSLALQEDARNNPDTLHLIVFDEAHWGVGKSVADKERSAAHEKLIGPWDCDIFNNVIILQVSATGYNLKSSSSSLPYDHLYLKLTDIENGDHKVMIAKRDGPNYKAVTSHDYGNNNESRAIPPEQVIESKTLHCVKWSECHGDNFRQGVNVRLRLPATSPPVWNSRSRSVSCASPPAWISKNISVPPGKHSCPVLVTAAAEDSLVLRISGESMKNLVITTEDQQYRLIVKHSGDSSDLCFVSCRDFNGEIFDAYVDSFEVSMSYGEDLMTIQTAPDKYGRKFHLTHTSYSTGDAISVTADVHLGRAHGLSDIGLGSPDLSCMFITDFCQPQKGAALAEYLSLNFYFNTMRNTDRKERLIRNDEDFTLMVKDVMYEEEEKSHPVVSAAQQLFPFLTFPTVEKATQDTPKKNATFNNTMSASYAFYILLHNSLKKCSLEFKTLEDMLKDPSKCLTNFHFRRNLARFKEQLNKNTTISAKCFQDYVDYKRRNYELETCDYTTHTGLFTFLCTSLLFLREGQVIHRFAELRKSLLENRKLYGALSTKFFRYKNDFKQFIIDHITEDETFNIICKVFEGSKFVVSRAHTRELGNVLFNTIIKARSISCDCPGEVNFAVIRDYDDKFGKDPFADISQMNIFRSFQPPRCQWENSKTLQRCDCSDYIPGENASLACASCGHQHKEMSNYEDMDGLPCILILVNKGRLGDTFPRSFSALDLRQWFHWDDVTENSGEPAIYLSRIVQELGRLCRYEFKPGVVTPGGKMTKLSDLPYVLIGDYLHGQLTEALESFAAFYGFFVDSRQLDEKLEIMDVYKSPSSKTSCCPRKWSLILRPSANNYDYRNEKRQHNRILLEAEPQIGKTGVYLNLISQLTQQLGLSDRSQVTTSIELEEDSDLSDSEEDEADLEDSEFRNLAGTVKVTETRAEGHYQPQLSGIVGLVHDAGLPDKHNKYRTVGGDNQLKRHAPSADTRAVNQKLKEQRWRRMGEETGRDEYRARDLSHLRDNCDLCSSEISDPVVTTTEASLKSDTPAHCTPVKVSVPHLKRFKPLLYELGICDLLQETFSQFQEHSQSADGDLKPRELESWIFTPTYHRAVDGCFNYRHAMVDGKGRKCTYVQLLVVREEEFDEYSHRWGKTLAIVQLPEKMIINGTIETAREGGIGYARHVILNLAKTWNLDQYYMIDDNYISIQELVTEMRGEKEYIVKDSENRVTTTNIPLFKALKEMERLLIYTDKPHEGVSRCVTMLGDSFQPAHGYDPGDLGAFTGDPRNYAVIGCHRDRGSRRINSNFRRANVYSLMLINLRHSAWNYVNFRCVTSREDVMLYEDLMKLEHKPLVVKFMRFMFRKANLRSQIAQKIYEWPEGVRLRSTCTMKSLIKVPDKKERLTLTSYINREFRPRYVTLNVRDSNRHKAERQWAADFTNISPGQTHLLIQLNTSANEDDVIKYLKVTSGIGGYRRHVFLFSEKYCSENDLKEKRDFVSKIVMKGFEDEASSKVLTTHRITDYKVNYVLLVVEGKIRDPCDELRECNFTRSTPASKTLGETFIDTKPARKRCSTEATDECPTKRVRSEETAKTSTRKDEGQLRTKAGLSAGAKCENGSGDSSMHTSTESDVSQLNNSSMHGSRKSDACKSPSNRPSVIHRLSSSHKPRSGPPSDSRHRPSSSPKTSFIYRPTSGPSSGLTSSSDISANNRPTSDPNSSHKFDASHKSSSDRSSSHKSSSDHSSSHKSSSDRSSSHKSSSGHGSSHKSSSDCISRHKSSSDCSSRHKSSSDCSSSHKSSSGPSSSHKSSSGPSSRHKSSSVHDSSHKSSSDRSSSHKSSSVHGSSHQSSSDRSSSHKSSSVHGSSHKSSSVHGSSHQSSSDRSSSHKSSSVHGSSHKSSSDRSSSHKSSYGPSSSHKFNSGPSSSHKSSSGPSSRHKSSSDHKSSGILMSTCNSDLVSSFDPSLKTVLGSRSDIVRKKFTSGDGKNLQLIDGSNNNVSNGVRLDKTKPREQWHSDNTDKNTEESNTTSLNAAINTYRNVTQVSSGKTVGVPTPMMPMMLSTRTAPVSVEALSSDLTAKHDEAKNIITCKEMSFSNTQSVNIHGEKHNIQKSRQTDAKIATIDNNNNREQCQSDSTYSNREENKTEAAETTHVTRDIAYGNVVAGNDVVVPRTNMVLSPNSTDTDRIEAIHSRSRSAIALEKQAWNNLTKKHASVSMPQSLQVHGGSLSTKKSPQTDAKISSLDNKKRTRTILAEQSHLNQRYQETPNLPRQKRVLPSGQNITLPINIAAQQSQARKVQVVPDQRAGSGRNVTSTNNDVTNSTGSNEKPSRDVATDVRVRDMTSHTDSNVIGEVRGVPIDVTKTVTESSHKRRDIVDDNDDVIGREYFMTLPEGEYVLKVVRKRDNKS